MKNFEPGFADRLSTGAKAKQALLKKAKEKAPRTAPGFAARPAGRVIAAKQRDARGYVCCALCTRSIVKWTVQKMPIAGALRDPIF